MQAAKEDKLKQISEKQNLRALEREKLTKFQNVFDLSSSALQFVNLPEASFISKMATTKSNSAYKCAGKRTSFIRADKSNDEFLAPYVVTAAIKSTTTEPSRLVSAIVRVMLSKTEKKFDYWCDGMGLGHEVKTSRLSPQFTSIILSSPSSSEIFFVCYAVGNPFLSFCVPAQKIPSPKTSNQNQNLNVAQFQNAESENDTPCAILDFSNGVQIVNCESLCRQPWDLFCASVVHSDSSLQLIKLCRITRCSEEREDENKKPTKTQAMRKAEIIAGKRSIVIEHKRKKHDDEIDPLDVGGVRGVGGVGGKKGEKETVGVGVGGLAGKIISFFCWECGQT